MKPSPPSGAPGPGSRPRSGPQVEQRAAGQGAEGLGRHGLERPLRCGGLALRRDRCGGGDASDRLRFPTPVPAGCRIHARYRIKAVEQVKSGTQMTMEINVHVVGQDRPSVINDLVMLYM